MKNTNINKIIGITTILLLGSMSIAQANDKVDDYNISSQHNNRKHNDNSKLTIRKKSRTDNHDDFNHSSVIFENEHLTRSESFVVTPVTASVSEPTTLIIFGAGLIGVYVLRRRNTNT